MTIRFVLTALLLAPGLASAAGRELSAEQQAAARKIYVAKCAKCHRFYDPKNYAETSWRTWMDKMSRVSKLKPEQEEVLNKYLDMYRAGELGKKPEVK